MKICVGLSGGVDSSVAALLLKEQGYDVFAMYMQNWHDIEGTLHGECEWEEEKFVAEMVARKIGIPFYFVDLSKEYMSRVADYMFDEYSKGRTPNPDVLCNSQIKFDAFLNAARKLGADVVATGHYCRKYPVGVSGDIPQTDSSLFPAENCVWRLLEGTDTNKCQGYFLCQLSQEQLSAALFPIGDLDKKEVRRIAAEAGLPSADKKDSQGICFVGKVDLPVFLQQKLKSVQGDVVEIPADSPIYSGTSADFRIVSQSGEQEILERFSRLTDRSGTGTLPAEQKIRERFGRESAGCQNPGKSLEELENLARPVKYEREDGKVIGQHEGAQFYTIGQRKGLNIGGHKEPLFVISTDTVNNIIYVGEGQSHPGLYRKALRINSEELHWIRPDLTMKVGESRACRVRIRYRQPLQDATLCMTEKGMFILFDEPQRGVTPGQFAVWYDKDGGACPEIFGSGVIAE